MDFSEIPMMNLEIVSEIVQIEDRYMVELTIRGLGGLADQEATIVLHDADAQKIASDLRETATRANDFNKIMSRFPTIEEARAKVMEYIELLGDMEVQ